MRPRPFEPGESATTTRIYTPRTGTRKFIGKIDNRWQIIGAHEYAIKSKIESLYDLFSIRTVLGLVGRGDEKRKKLSKFSCQAESGVASNRTESGLCQ